MRFTIYPTERAFKNREYGVNLNGQVWADAPGGGNQWVIPDGCRQPIIVTTRANSHGGKPFAIGSIPAEAVTTS